MFKLKIDEKLHLELTAMHHADRLFELVKKNSELFSHWLVWVESTKTVDDTRTFIQSAMNKYAKHQEVNCVIVYEGCVVGDIALLGMGRKHNGTRQGELGYWLDGDYHGKGIMHRCAKKMIEIGFNYYDLDKIRLRCAVENNRSCNVAQMLGFTLEGHIRDDILINGKMLDANLYGFLREEFEIKFDTERRQYMSINQDNITKAWFFASRVHKEQFYPGEKLPYITHIGNVMMEVMAVSSELENPELAIICAILHDTIEDTPTTYADIKKEFGKAVADGVMALTKNETLETKREQMLDSLERIIKQPKEVWLVKVADRTANLGEPPHYWTFEKVKSYQDEARIILDYLGRANEPMAERLRGKIEDYEKFLDKI